MGYLEIEDRNVRKFFEKEIIDSIKIFVRKEKERCERYTSLENFNETKSGKKAEQLSVIDSCSAFFDQNSENILDMIENDKLFFAIKELSEEEQAILTKAFVKNKTEYEIAQDLETTSEQIFYKKLKIIEKLRSILK